MPPRPISSSSSESRARPHAAVGREDVVAWLDGRINHERTASPGRWGLRRMRQLLALLGQPHKGVAVVHVAGTKGKGSTVAMLAGIFQASGYRVGRYMSPHVHDIEERIAINGHPISGADLTAAWKQVKTAVEEMDARATRRGARGPTWFEILTAIAFLSFRERGVDLAVMETGLGGRLDATNVCEPILSVITSISLDHMAELGDSVPLIAREKAGIIKRGCPVLCGARDEDARRVITEVAARRRAPLVAIDRDFTVRIATPTSADGSAARQTVEVMPLVPRRFSLPEEARGREPCEVRMVGSHQAHNAGVAIAAASLLHARGSRIRWNGVRRALATVALPARIEEFGERPRVIVDAAHNAASMAALFQTLACEDAPGGRRVLVFAASAEKQLVEMLSAAEGWADQLVLTRFHCNPRAAALEMLRAAAATAVPALAAACVEEADPLHALQIALRLAGARGVVCVAGSFFLAAEVRQHLLAKTSAPLR
jgi:dihydrofolate synthase/folylpolyglutamate synthase